MRTACQTWDPVPGIKPAETTCSHAQVVAALALGIAAVIHRGRAQVDDVDHRCDVAMKRRTGRNCLSATWHQPRSSARGRADLDRNTAMGR